MISWNCIACGELLEAPESLGGGSILCPRCSTGNAVPARFWTHVNRRWFLVCLAGGMLLAGLYVGQRMNRTAIVIMDQGAVAPQQAPLVAVDPGDSWSHERSLQIRTLLSEQHGWTLERRPQDAGMWHLTNTRQFPWLELNIGAVDVVGDDAFFTTIVVDLSSVRDTDERMEFMDAAVRLGCVCVLGSATDPAAERLLSRLHGSVDSGEETAAGGASISYLLNPSADRFVFTGYCHRP